MQNLYTELENLLSSKPELIANGKLLKNKTQELANHLDADLLKRLLSHEQFKKLFFQEIDNFLVFDKIKFRNFLNHKNFLPDSYMQFANKIGLIAPDDYQDRFLSKQNAVVLAFPYKR